MPSSNPVYQPTTTTVTYERHKEWPASYLSNTVIPNCHQKAFLQRLLLIGAIVLAIVGLGMAIYALVADANAHNEDYLASKNDVDLSRDDGSEEENFDPEFKESVDGPEDNHDHETNVVVGSVGICLVLLSLGMYICFLRIRGVCNGVHMIPTQNTRAGHGSQNLEISNHVDSHASGVSYKGVQESSALNLEPSAPTEEERHSLMDSKYQSEDTERMMDDDPRIVLKPLRTAEEA